MPSSYHRVYELGIITSMKEKKSTNQILIKQKNGMADQNLLILAFIKPGKGPKSVPGARKDHPKRRSK